MTGWQYCNSSIEGEVKLWEVRKKILEELRKEKKELKKKGVQLIKEEDENILGED